jgi:hypothetical protein
MAKSDTFATTNLGAAVSNTEQLMRGAYLTSPSNSPFYSNTSKSKAGSIMPEWTLDDYDTIDNTPVAEGADYTAFDDAFAKQARVFNYITTREVQFQVSNIQELVDNAAGVNFAGAMKKKMVELNMKTEKALLSADARAISGKVRTAAGLAKQLGGASGIFPKEYETPAAQVVSGTAATEANVDTVLRSLFDEVGTKGNFRIYGGSAWINQFAQNTMRLTSSDDNRTSINLNGEKGVVKNKVRIYEGQHGTVEVFDLNSKTLYDTTNKDMAYFIDPSMVEIQELGGLDVKRLPDLGGGPRAGIRRHFALCVKNPRNHAYWDALA